MNLFFFSTLIWAQEPNGDVFTNNKETVDIEDKAESTDVSYEDEETLDSEALNVYRLRLPS